MAADNARNAQTRAADARRPVPARLERRDAPAANARPGMIQTQAATTSLFAWLAVYPPPRLTAALTDADAEPRDDAVEDAVGQQPPDHQHHPRVAADQRRARASARPSAPSRSSRRPPRAGCRGSPVSSSTLSIFAGIVAVLRAPARAGSCSSLGLAAALVPDRRRDRPRLDQRDLDARAVQLDAQRVADGLDRVLGGRVGAVEAHRDSAADRGDEDDPPTGAPQRRQQRARDRDLPEEVDVELAAPLLVGEHLQRPADADPGVVDERVEPAGRRRGARRLGRGGDLRRRRSRRAAAARSARRTPRRRAARRPRSRAHAGEHRPARSLARRSAVARPMPVEAPVIRTVGTGAQPTSARTTARCSGTAEPAAIGLPAVNATGPPSSSDDPQRARAAHPARRCSLVLAGCGSGLGAGRRDSRATLSPRRARRR